MFYDKIVRISEYSCRDKGKKIFNLLFPIYNLLPLFALYLLRNKNINNISEKIIPLHTV